MPAQMFQRVHRTKTNARAQSAGVTTVSKSEANLPIDTVSSSTTLSSFDNGSHLNAAMSYSNYVPFIKISYPRTFAGTEFQFWQTSLAASIRNKYSLHWPPITQSRQSWPNIRVSPSNRINQLHRMQKKAYANVNLFEYEHPKKFHSCPMRHIGLDANFWTVLLPGQVPLLGGTPAKPANRSNMSEFKY